MAISGKTRKLLWGRSYDACAICKKSLTRDADSPHLPGIVLGEEAHIVAKRPDGPRGDGDRSDVDGFNNLLLLCADDHKRVDEQPRETAFNHASFEHEQGEAGEQSEARH